VIDYKREAIKHSDSQHRERAKYSSERWSFEARNGQGMKGIGPGGERAAETPKKKDKKTKVSLLEQGTIEE